MIQRIQTLYLLIAAIIEIVAIVLFVNWYNFTSVYATFISPMALAAIVSTVSIFLFSNRKKQMTYIKRGNVFLLLALIFPAVCLFTQSENLTKVAYLITIVSPIVAMLFNHLAWKAVKKDDLKVKAADRIR